MDPLSPDLAFRAGNLLVLAGWVALALSPPSRRWTPRVWQITGLGLPLLLAAAYVALLLGHWGPGGFGSLAESSSPVASSSRPSSSGDAATRRVSPLHAGAGPPA